MPNLTGFFRHLKPAKSSLEDFVNGVNFELIWRKRPAGGSGLYPDANGSGRHRQSPAISQFCDQEVRLATETIINRKRHKAAADSGLLSSGVYLVCFEPPDFRNFGGLAGIGLPTLT